MLKSILDMDKKSRIQADEAEEAKRKAFEELASVRTSLIDEKLAQARKIVDTLREKELEKAEETAKILRQKNETARAKLKTMYTENSEKWVSEIFSQIIE